MPAIQILGTAIIAAFGVLFTAMLYKIDGWRMVFFVYGGTAVILAALAAATGVFNP